MSGDLTSQLVVGLAGSWPNADEAAWISEHRPAGVILFSHNINDFNQLYDLCQILHQLSPGLEIMADHEGGPVSQLAGALGRPPSAWSLGVLDDTGLTARVFQETGRRLGAAGLDRVLAPVADVLTEPRNPVIGVRAFGPHSLLVTRHTVAAVTGLLQSGMKVCLKHWPGHGGSRGDSHLTETGVGEGAIPAPFEGGLTAGADAVMVGHLLGSAEEDGGAGLPATLNRDFLISSRAVLGQADAAGLKLFADDVTMGALGPAMNRLGVAAPAPEESGLFDPAALPRTWFEQLADAGCDRILIRGIPTGAFPLSQVQAPAPTRPESASVTEQEALGEVYTEARKRLWALAGSGFAHPDKDLAWLDLSTRDRWQVAAGQRDHAGRGATTDPLCGCLRRMFRKVVLISGSQFESKNLDRLVVSSHRPLPPQVVLPGNLAARGLCLALGHPSLQVDLEGLLGGNWEVRALYDIAPEDLICGLEGR